MQLSLAKFPQGLSPPSKISWRARAPQPPPPPPTKLYTYDLNQPLLPYLQFITQISVKVC